MNTKQISAILKCDSMTKDSFRGVYAIDQLPSWEPGAYVVNTDEQDKPGEHWVAVFDKEYFDSYGLPPLDARLIDFLENDYEYNNVQLQQPLSTACGFYCVYYILERARDVGAETIINVLKNSDSDFIVKNMVFDRYKPLFY